MSFTAVTEHRAQLGEGPFWDAPTQALYWVDIAGRQALRLIGANVQIWQMPEHVSAFIPCASGDALVTRFSDRARDRHAKENHFQAYDHYLTFYWEDRTAAIEIVDYVAKGGSSIRMNVVTQNKLHDTEAENRWWYIGMNTLAEFCGNGVMNMVDYTHYWKEESYNCREGRPIQVGDKLEFEISQFLDAATLPRGRSNYYGTTFLYIVGQGIVPWDVTDKQIFQPGRYLQRDSVPVPVAARWPKPPPRWPVWPRCWCATPPTTKPRPPRTLPSW